MKVAHVIVSGEVAGGQTVCGQIIEALKKRGDRAIVVSPTEGVFAERLRKDNIPVYLIPFRKTYHIQNAFHLARILRKEHVDIVHTHAMVQVNVQARLGAWLAGLPVISHLHTPNHFRSHPIIRRYQILLDNWTAQLCSEIVTVSESTKEALAAQGCVYHKAKVVYNGIDVDHLPNLKTRTSVFREFNLQPTHRLIGTVGMLCPIKGQKEFIFAAKEILSQIPETVFMVVGKDIEMGGSYESELRDLSFKLGLDGKLIFTGYRSDALSLINAFDVFVLPSKLEGLPITILEAMALRKAVVAAKTGGVPEVVIHDKTGILVGKEDVPRLAQSVIELLRNSEKTIRIGENGHQQVKQFFSEEKMIEEIFDIYDQVLTRRGRRFNA